MNALAKTATDKTLETPLAVSAIAKSFGKKMALAGVSFTLEQGEIFGLIGLNGAGKTTLIKIILDLVKADKGTASIFGLSSTVVAARESISYLPEKFQPSGYLIGREYLSLAMSYYGHTLDMDVARKMAVALDLDAEVLERKVNTYSKGMGQKLGLAGACLIDQPFLILDEPMSGLDPRARICLKVLLQEMKAKGKTVFFSSHILADIDEICDRIGVLHDGKMVFIGTPGAFKLQTEESSLEQAFLKAIG